jgi:protein-tyrosine phosphatase
LTDVFDVLFVCTGNICRSPMAEFIFACRLREALGPEADSFRVHSAGTSGLDGYPINAPAASAIAHLGVDTGDFRAREVNEAMLAESDLVLTAMRHHRGSVARLLPRITSRAFTIREFGRLVAQIDPAELPAGPPVRRARALVELAAAQRGRQFVLSVDDDIQDPYGGHQSEFAESVNLIEAAVAPVVRMLATGAAL